MKTAQRLYDQIKPNRYRLMLTPNLTGFTFKAEESVEVTLTTPSKKLVFHAVDLKISKASASGHAAQVSYQPKDQTVTFEFDTELSSDITFEISYSGKLRDDMHGFYRSSYQGESGETRWLATTQFEATAAREAFICIDEPAAKAVFDVTLVIPGDLTAISNTNPASEKIDGNLKTVIFSQTPKMSTYLLAFLIGNFERITTTSQKGIEVGVYTVPGKGHQGQFALKIGAKILDFYADYFGIAYPLPKLDMIAIPDFAAGAMENWGAVTYRERALLVDPNNSALASKQYVAMVVAHELAHQWFGNLVTMAWWTDLWLNEGFATWVAVLAVDHIYPEWDMWTQFVINDYNEARRLDALATTHPIQIEVHHPDEIGEIFDAISYSKGASLLRMLNHFLGEDVFKKGLHSYLTAFSYNNATTADLWQHLEQASGIAVTKIMQAWTTQPGFPLITQSGDVITQQRFYANPQQSGTSETWPIPLSFVTERGVSSPIIVDSAEGKLAGDNTSWEKPNAEQTGFYLINYSAEQLKSLEKAFDKLSVIDRFGVVSDSAMLMPVGKLSSDHFLELAASLRDNRDFPVWMAVLEGLGDLLMIADDETAEQMEAFIRWLTEPIVEYVGWEVAANESHLITLLRPLVLGLAGRVGNQTVVAKARELFLGHVTNKDLVPDLRMAVYRTVAHHGDKLTYDQFLELLADETLQEEQIRLLGALSRFQQLELITQTLERIMSDSVRAQDKVLVLMSVIGNRKARELSWEFVQDQWPQLVKLYGSGGHMLTRIPQALGDNFARHDTANKFEKFFANNPAPGIERTVEQMLEQIRLQADWWSRDESKIKAYLKHFLTTIQ